MTQENLKKLLKHFKETGQQANIDQILSNPKYKYLAVPAPVVEETKSKVKK